VSGKDGDIAQRRRGDRLIKEYIHDPYMTRSKPVEPTVCPECGVVMHGGRWQWLPEVPADAHRGLCPACQRIRDSVPAGFLVMSGDFLAEHRDEIMNLIHNKVDAERAHHPMKRLMNVENDDGSVVVTFTDNHLPRGVGEAIERAYEGELEIQYTPEAATLRVYWHR
jgi:NMD protein affecting ribosome stability and mRNA decay